MNMRKKSSQSHRLLRRHKRMRLECLAHQFSSHVGGKFAGSRAAACFANVPAAALTWRRLAV